MPLKCIVICLVAAIALSSCSPWQVASTHTPQPDVLMSRVGENEYELRIYDEGFRRWFARHAVPINFHTQEQYEEMNDRYASVWNEKAASKQFSLISSPVHTPINYDASIDYGLEIDYLLFHYFKYVEFRYGRLIKAGDVPSVTALGAKGN